MKVLPLDVFFSLILFATFSRTTWAAKQEKRRILDRMLSTYDPSIRPNGTGGTGPVDVKVNIFLRSISEMDDVKMEYSVQMTFRQEWKDDRLSYDNKAQNIDYLILTDAKRIWRPDAFFANEKSGHFHDIVMPNVLIRISPDGSIMYSTRISLRLSCPMDLRYYPMDVQECEIRIGSYAYTTRDIKFEWRAADPVQLSKSMHLPRFSLKSFLTDYCTSRTTTGDYSCIKVLLRLSRQFSYYLFQVYVPSIVLVMLSWVTFWLDQRATAARVAIWVTVLLTLAIKMAGINAKLPAVSYTKAIDVWTGTCLMFVFAVLFELAWVMQCVAAEDREKLDANADDSVAKKHEHANERGHTDRTGGFIRRFLSRFSSRGQRIDGISRILFPLAFAFFNLIYWSTYSQTVNMEGTKYN